MTERDRETDVIELQERGNCLAETQELFDVRPRFISIEELQVRETIAVFMGLAMLLLASSVPLALGTPPESPIPIHIKAPWMFGGIQWLLLRFPVSIAGWIIPAASLGFLLTLPWWARRAGVRWGRFAFMVLAMFWSIITLAYALQA
ncbi:MAG: hypothetical protein QMC95_05865 [Desulfitobacteriaceae bacterium]|nr:hypothetical protein [Desulfitobacteriaceae bacterium]MDI6879249.1 hypothetical protein [Desulfitobacteriaceae bacterium]MDI6913729.1 hypothetical protein [Desulfitobacteriaceae bacterium]